jgi:hypothetical protein
MMHAWDEDKNISMTRHASVQLILRNPSKPLTVGALYNRESVKSILLAEVVCSC